MARFEIGQSITTAEPTITVDAGLPIGRHRFRLVVVGGRRQPSVPDEAIVEIQRLTIDPRSPTGPVLEPRQPVPDLPPPVVGPASGGITRPIVLPSPRRSRPPGTRAPRKKERP